MRKFRKFTNSIFFAQSRVLPWQWVFGSFFVGKLHSKFVDFYKFTYFRQKWSRKDFKGFKENTLKIGIYTAKVLEHWSWSKPEGYVVQHIIDLEYSLTCFGAIICYRKQRPFVLDSLILRLIIIRLDRYIGIEGSWIQDQRYWSWT